MTENRIIHEGLAILGEAAEKLKALLNREQMALIDASDIESGPTIDASLLTKSSSTRIHVYIAGCQGCARLAKTWGPPMMRKLGRGGEAYVAKIGTTIGDLEARLRQIGRDQFGSAIRQRGQLVIDKGYSAWVAHQIITSRAPNCDAIRLHPRSISVDLPEGMSRRMFDSTLHRALKHRSLADICLPGMPERLVPYGMGGATRVSRASELYILSPHLSSDVDFLLTSIEGILSSIGKHSQ